MCFRNCSGSGCCSSAVSLSLTTSRNGSKSPNLRLQAESKKDLDIKLHPSHPVSNFATATSEQDSSPPSSSTSSVSPLTASPCSWIEPHTDPNFAAIPTYPVVLALKGADNDLNLFSERVKSGPISGLPKLDPNRVVHATQSIEVLKPLPLVSGDGWVWRSRYTGVQENSTSTFAPSSHYRG